MKDRIKKVVELDAPVSRVWRALTDHREFGQWFRVDLDGPFETGKITSGKVTYPGYQHLEWQAVVECMDASSLFAFSWPVEPIENGAKFASVPKNRVEFRLEPTETGTRLTITESGFASLPDPDRLEALRRNTRGWNEQVRNIATHVES